MDSSATPKRISFLGSLKRLTRKPSNASTKSDDGSHADIKNPFLHPYSSSCAQSSSQSSAPPPYTETVQSAGPSAAVSPARSESDLTEDQYAFLTQFDTVFLIDDSSSMTIDSRWTETSEALKIIAPICTKRDADGIDVYFLNNRNTAHSEGGYLNITSTEAVSKLFDRVRPSGPTFTGMRIEEILRPYLERLKKHQKNLKAAGVKPLNLIVITDGFPLDPLEEALLDVAKTLDEVKAPSYQLGVQLFQVGSDPQATEYLKRMDDDLKAVCNPNSPGAIRDIVDTVTWESNSGKSVFGGRRTLSAKGILKVVLGGVVKRLDRDDLKGK